MLKHVVTVGLLAGALTLPHKAEAAFITGTLNFSASVMMVDSTGTLVGTQSAKGIDFITLGADDTPTPGTAGDLFVTGSSTGSSFKADGITFGTTGTIEDFSFAGTPTGTAATNFPLPPLTGFQFISTSGNTFTFDLTSISISQQDPSFLSLLGLGTMYLTGFDPTPGQFLFSTQGSGGRLSFSSSLTDQPVPEPGSMVLLGTGLIGLAVLARKRLFSH